MHKVLPEMTGQLVHKGQQAYKELQVMLAPQVLWELPAHKVLPEMTGQLARKAQQAYKELQVMLEQQVL